VYYRPVLVFFAEIGVTFGAGLVAGLVLGQPSTGQPAGTPNDVVAEAAVRALVRQAQAKASGDPTELVLALDRAVRARWGDFESFPLSIVRREDLVITLTTPFMGFRRALAEHLRMRQPLRDVTWVATVVIVVSPERLEAPDIERLVVERDGRAIGPLKDLLRPMTYTNGRDEKAVIHSGELHFPVSAFAPGATVTIRAVPKDGAEFVFTLQDSQLRPLR
jgi:hypothetical protein